MDDERMRILRRVEAGEISAEEAVRQLNALGQATQAEAEPQVAQPEPPASTSPDVPKGLAEFWRYPLYVGVGHIVLGAVLLYAVYGASASGLWAVCGWPLFALGVMITAAAWWLRTARWIHVRVSGRENIAISLPLPLKLTAWVVKIARPFVPRLRDTGVDEVIMGLGDALKEGNQPLYVDVNDDEEGEHVQIYIG
jgi:hypothetical protein